MWHRRRGAGLVIRLSGVAPLGISFGAARLLFAHAGSPTAVAGALGYCLATVAFACASVGSAMLLAGAHLFDQVEVSPRWRRLF